MKGNSCVAAEVTRLKFLLCDCALSLSQSLVTSAATFQIGSNVDISHLLRGRDAALRRHRVVEARKSCAGAVPFVLNPAVD